MKVNEECVSNEIALGRIFRQKRVERRLSQKALAELVGMGFDNLAIWRLEHGEVLLNREIVEAVSKALKFEIPKEQAPKFRFHGNNKEKRSPVGVFIYEKRLELGLKQSCLASAVGVSPPAISYLEKGKNPPSRKLRSKLEDFFGCKLPVD